MKKLMLMVAMVLGGSAQATGIIEPSPPNVLLAASVPASFCLSVSAEAGLVLQVTVDRSRVDEPELKAGDSVLCYDLAAGGELLVTSYSDAVVTVL